MGSHKVRVTFDEDDWEDMVDGSPASLRDPEVVRFWVSLGMTLIKERREGLRAVEYSDLKSLTEEDKEALREEAADSSEDDSESEDLEE